MKYYTKLIDYKQMFERTPPLNLVQQESTSKFLKMIDPKIDDSDFDSNTSSEVCRNVPLD